MRQTILKQILYFFVACDKGIEKKAKNKHPSKFEFHQRYQIALGYLRRKKSETETCVSCQDKTIECQ